MAQRLFDLVRQCGAELGQDIRWQSTGGVCDGNNIAAVGVPVVDHHGRVREGRFQLLPQEYLIVPSLCDPRRAVGPFVNRAIGRKARTCPNGTVP